MVERVIYYYLIDSTRKLICLKYLQRDSVLNFISLANLSRKLFQRLVHFCSTEKIKKNIFYKTLM